MMYSVNLTDFIKDADSKYTILAPQDDVLSAYGDDNFPEKGSDNLKRLLKYHFLPGRWTPKSLKDGLLIETKLVEPGLAGKAQVLEASVNHDDERHVQSTPSISFGGASTIGDPSKSPLLHNQAIILTTLKM